MKYSNKVIEMIQSANLDKVNENIELAFLHDDEDTLYLLGNTLFQLGFLEETKRVYNHLIDINPSDDELKIYLAEIEIEDGKELEALNLLHSIEDNSPSYPQALLVQADYYHLNGLPEVSIQKLEEAEELMPEEPIIKFAIGEVHFTTADYQKATNYYELLLEDGIEDIAGTLIHSRLGNAYLMLGSYKKAINSLRESLALKDDPEVYYQLGFAHTQQEDFQKGIDSLNEAKEMDPSLISVYVLLASAYEQLNQLEDSMKAIEEGISFNEVNIGLYLLAAEYAAKLNEYDKAEEYYQKALLLEPENEHILIKYAQYLNYMGEYEDIVELFSKTPKSIQVLPEVMWLLANAHNELDDYDKARELFDQTYDYLDANLDFLKDFIFFLREDGQREKMQEVLSIYTTMVTEYDDEIASLLDDLSYE